MKNMVWRIMALVVGLCILTANSCAATTSVQEAEHSRAVALGILPEGIERNLDEPISLAEFSGMISFVLEKAGSEAQDEWRSLSGEFPDVSEMLRQDAMVVLLLAAECMGIDAYNQDWGVVHEAIDDRWEEIDGDRALRLFTMTSREKGIGEEPPWDSFMTAAYFYAMGRASETTGSMLLDIDDSTGSLAANKPLTRKDAVLAVLRLYESSPTPIERVPAEDDREILAKAETRTEGILSNADPVTISGTTYYVSADGNDSLNGKTPETAWATLQRVNEATLLPGDGVLFERGGTYRGNLQHRDHITYSAYGKGEKPRLYGSPENGVGAEKWSLVDGYDNIWAYHMDMLDVGGIVMNEGEQVALKQTAFWNGDSFVLMRDKSTVFSLSMLVDMHFFSDIDFTGLSSEEATHMQERAGALYLRCDAGNPGKVFSSIEFLGGSSGNEFLIEAGENVVIDNLCIRYYGGSGIVIGSHSVVQHCEVGYVGGSVVGYDAGMIGSVLDGEDPGIILRVGDGIVVGRGEGSIVRDNYVHHAYDQSITVEIGPGGEEAQRFAKDVLIEGNVTAYSSGNMLIADWDALQNGYEDHSLFENIRISDNFFLYSGYGWSHRTRDDDWGEEGLANNGNCTIFFGYPEKTGIDISVIENVFYLSKYALVGFKSPQSLTQYEVSFEGNTYIQNAYGTLAVWEIPESPVLLRHYDLHISTDGIQMGLEDGGADVVAPCF